GRDCREGPGRPGPRLHRERVLAPPAGPLRRWMGQAASGGFSEVVMGRPAEVFVRPVSMTEGRRLQRIGRTAKDPVRLRRAVVVLMSAQGGKRAGYRAPAGLLTGGCARGGSRVQRERVSGLGPKMERGQAQNDQ